MNTNQTNEKLSKNKLLIIIIAGVVLIALIIIIAVSGSKKNGGGKITVANTVSFGDTELVDKHFGNTHSGGLITGSGNNLYYIDNDFHCIKDAYDNIVLESNDKIYNLYYDDGLYFINGNKIMFYDPSSKKTEAAPMLDKFKSDDLQLYITTDYYFVYTDKTLYRVAKADGTVEQSLSVMSGDSFALCYGNLYYIKTNQYGQSMVIQTEAYDFEDELADTMHVDENDYFEMITATGGRLFTLSRKKNDETYSDINSFADLDRPDLFCKIDVISHAMQDDGESDLYLSDFNVLSNHILLTVRNDKGYSHTYRTSYEVLGYDVPSLYYDMGQNVKGSYLFETENDMYGMYYLDEENGYSRNYTEWEDNYMIRGSNSYNQYYWIH